MFFIELISDLTDICRHLPFSGSRETGLFTICLLLFRYDTPVNLLTDYPGRTVVPAVLLHPMYLPA